MARIRSIKPGFWTDSTMVRLSCWARLFYIGTWNFALCEKGHLPDDAFELKLQILPADDVDVDKLLAELIDAGRIERRKTRSGSTYLVAARIPNHNKSDARWASKCQYCNEECTDEPTETPASSDEAHRDSREFTDTPESSPQEGNRKGGEGYISASGEPMQEFALEEPITGTATPEVGSDDDPKWCEFWDLVPRKQGRDEAREAWTNHVLGKGTYKGKPIKKADPDVMIAGMRLYAQRVKREHTERQHIKMPQGWINGRRWIDELEQQSTRAQVTRDPEGIWR